MTRIFILVESTAMVTTARWSCSLLFFASIEIVLPSLSFIRKNCIGIANSLERLRGSWRFILVRVESQRKFPEGWFSKIWCWECQKQMNTGKLSWDQHRLSLWKDQGSRNSFYIFSRASQPPPENANQLNGCTDYLRAMECQGWLKVHYNVWNHTFKYEKIELLVCIYEIPRELVFIYGISGHSGWSSPFGSLHVLHVLWSSIDVSIKD